MEEAAGLELGELILQELENNKNENRQLTEELTKLQAEISARDNKNAENGVAVEQLKKVRKELGQEKSTSKRLKTELEESFHNCEKLQLDVEKMRQKENVGADQVLAMQKEKATMSKMLNEAVERLNKKDDAYNTALREKALLQDKLAEATKQMQALAGLLAGQDLSGILGTMAAAAPPVPKRKDLGKADPKLWTVQQVSTWLAQIDLRSHIQTFVANAVDGDMLFDLTREDFGKDLEITNPAHIDKILSERYKLHLPRGKKKKGKTVVRGGRKRR